MATGTRARRYARRRQRRIASKPQDLTQEQWAAILRAWDGCAYCLGVQGPFQKDCVLPISRGGRYTVTNVVPACRSCNASKCNTEVSAWLRRKGHDEPRFLERFARISRDLVAAEAPA